MEKAIGIVLFVLLIAAIWFSTPNKKGGKLAIFMLSMFILTSCTTPKAIVKWHDKREFKERKSENVKRQLETQKR